MNEKIFILTLTDNEVSVLLQLLDGSVRHFGRQAAASVAHLEQKLLAAQKPRDLSIGSIPPEDTIKTPAALQKPLQPGTVPVID